MTLILGAKCIRFEWNGHMLAAHEECWNKYKDCRDINEFPDGPMKRAYQAAQEPIIPV